MRVSSTLSFYIGRHFLLTFLSLFGLFLLIILLFDTIELLRRASSRPDVTFTMVMEMALLKLPFLGQETFPFAVLFGGMAVFWRLTRSNELVVTRGAGVSVWQFLLPVVFVSFLLGVLQATAISPVASSMLARYDQLEAIRLEGKSSFLTIARSGLWLRQSSAQGHAVVHAERVLIDDTSVEISNVMVVQNDGKDGLALRINGEKARLEDGFWRISSAWLYDPEKPAEFTEEYWLETDLTPAKIQDNFAPPETMSFWDLPAFIATLEESGFSAVRHRLYWHTLLAAPILTSAMVIIAATFTLRHARRGGTTAVVGAGVMTGFALYFLSDVIFALGLSNSIPIALAAWAPSSVALFLGASMLLHLEDG